MTAIAKIIANNIKLLREARAITQAGLAKQSGLPRSTLATLESGSVNPSIDTLIKVSKALGLSLDELIAQPRPATLLLREKEIQKVVHAGGKVVQHKLLPDPIYGMEIDRLVLAAKTRMRGTPHIRQTREYLHCNSGEIELFCDGEKFQLRAGDLLAFPGDLPHSYYNPGDLPCSCFSVVVLPALAVGKRH
jgi:transcriptional regulator with XRE-family HTH domain